MYTFYLTYIYYIVSNYLNEWRDVNMGFRVRGRIKICKGLYINVGKKGITSVSAKVGGATINKNRNGRVKATSKVCKGVSYETTLKKPNKQVGNIQNKQNSFGKGLLLFLFFPMIVMFKLSVLIFKLTFFPLVLMFKILKH